MGLDKSKFRPLNEVEMPEAQRVFLRSRRVRRAYWDEEEGYWYLEMRG